MEANTVSQIAAVLAASGPWGLVAILAVLVYRGAAKILSLAEAQTAALVSVRNSLDEVEKALQGLRATFIDDLQRRAKSKSA
jgi:hypothetical protein